MPVELLLLINSALGLAAALIARSTGGRFADWCF